MLVSDREGFSSDIRIRRLEQEDFSFVDPLNHLIVS